MFQLYGNYMFIKIFARFVSILLDFSPLGDSPISGPLGPYNFSIQFSCNFEPLGDPHPESSTIPHFRAFRAFLRPVGSKRPSAERCVTLFLDL